MFWPAKKEKDLHETICNASIHENVENSINLSINSVQSETEKEIVDRATEKKRKSEFFRLGQALPKT